MSKTRVVKCTNNDLILLSKQLGEFKQVAEKSKLVLPGSISYALHRNEQFLMKSLQEYENRRVELLGLYVKKDDAGNFITKKDKETGATTVVFSSKKSEKEFDEAFNDLLSDETTVEFYNVINVDDKVSTLTGEQAVLNQLWYLIDVYNNWKKEVVVKKLKKS